MQRMRVRIAERWAAVIVLPLAAHAALSWIGFNPTDDGFVLAGSTRILWGEVPHRDFLSIRPPGSFYLHLPEAWLGGDRTFWWSRLTAWVEWGITGWAWSGLAEWAAGIAYVPGVRLALAVVGAALCAHQFPPMAWHSIDAVALASAGLLLVARGGRWAAPAGAALLGGSALCRQNLLPMLPLGLLLVPGALTRRTIVGGAVPFACYGLLLIVTGSTGAALDQLRARTGLWEPGLQSWALRPMVWVAIVAGLIAGWKNLNPSGVLARTILLTAVLAAVHTLSVGGLQGTPSFALTAAAAGLAIAAPGRWRRIAALAAALGWCASISLGYNSPALGCGAAGVVLLAYAGTTWPPGHTAYRIPVLLLAIVTGAAQVHVRQRHVYRDLPAALLTADLGPVLAGGRGIRTNPETAKLLADLRIAIDKAGRSRYAVIPDLAAHWVRADRPNPVFVDWAFNVELANPRHMLRVMDDLTRSRGKLVVIVQKYRADALAEARVPFSGPPYDMVGIARTLLTKTGETEFFDLYR